VQLIDDDHGHTGVQADAADLLDHVGDVGPPRNGQAEEPGELHRDHLAGRGRRHGDVDDGDVVAGARVPVPVHHLGRLGDAVHPDQVASAFDDALDDRSLDHDQAGMVLQAPLLVRGALAVIEREPSGLGEQVRDRGHGRDELPPAGQRGQLHDRIGAARTRRGQRHFSASRNGSKIGIGTTAASLAA
jgi:hypothetical protein